MLISFKEYSLRHKNIPRPTVFNCFFDVSPAYRFIRYFVQYNTILFLLICATTCCTNSESYSPQIYRSNLCKHLLHKYFVGKHSRKYCSLSDNFIVPFIVPFIMPLSFVQTIFCGIFCDSKDTIFLLFIQKSGVSSTYTRQNAAFIKFTFIFTNSDYPLTVSIWSSPFYKSFFF